AAPKNSFARAGYKRFHKSPSFGERLGPEYHAKRDSRQAIRNATLLGFPLAQANAGKLRVGEQAEWHLPSGRYAMAALNILSYNVEIVFRDVSEMGAASAFTRCPNIRRRGFQALIDFYVPTAGCL